ncbi:MAG: ATP-binding cassette domain-containing protein, partial [Gammaproteobacteria bacterium]|nr:ATP-binding cassette domain-containing protein [Gammaproteobacteria bacterium]
MSSTVHVLEAKHLGKRYQSRWVVADVSMQVRSREVVGLLGPNGAGKTTAFYMIVGLVRPNRGQVLLDGENIAKLPLHARAVKGISYLPQEPSIFRKLTVSDNILAIL